MARGFGKRMRNEAERMILIMSSIEDTAKQELKTSATPSLNFSDQTCWRVWTFCFSSELSRSEVESNNYY